MSRKYIKSKISSFEFKTPHLTRKFKKKDIYGERRRDVNDVFWSKIKVGKIVPKIDYAQRMYNKFKI